MRDGQAAKRAANNNDFHAIAPHYSNDSVFDFGRFDRGFAKNSIQSGDRPPILLHQR
jgi:hypothetical protein